MHSIMYSVRDCQLLRSHKVIYSSLEPSPSEHDGLDCDYNDVHTSRLMIMTLRQRHQTLVAHTVENQASSTMVRINKSGCPINY